MKIRLISTITTDGSPRYIPRFSIITEIPIFKTSGSVSAFSISDGVEINGVFFNNVKFRD